jgi:hypothetical protein
LWKFDDSRLKNKAKGEEWCLKIYNENGEWNLKTGIDATKTTVLIENVSTNMVLSVEERGKKVIEEQKEDDNRRQIWYKSKLDRKGYFTLKNTHSAMLLTVTSSNDIMVRGNFINLTILSSYDYDNSRYMPNSRNSARSFGYLPYSMYIVFEKLS